jgi:hypothetical protein
MDLSTLSTLEPELDGGFWGEQRYRGLIGRVPHAADKAAVRRADLKEQALVTRTAFCCSAAYGVEEQSRVGPSAWESTARRAYAAERATGRRPFF